MKVFLSLVVGTISQEVSTLDSSPTLLISSSILVHSDQALLKEICLSHSVGEGDFQYSDTTSSRY